MTLTVLLAAVAAVIVPIVLRRVWRSSKKVIYQGLANPITRGLEDLGQRTGTRYCHFEIQDKTRYVAEISIEDHARLKYDPAPAVITVVKYPLMSPEVESITFAWETSKKPAISAAADGLYLSVFYLLAGLGALALSVGLEDALVARLVSYSSAALFILSGFTITCMQDIKPRGKDVAVRLLGFIPLGTGMASLLVALALALAGTVLTFHSVSILTFLLGINAAFAVGGIAAILWKMRQKETA
jgi:hypothetical protein